MIKKLINAYRKNFWTAERYAKHIGVKIGKGCSIATRYFGSEPYLITIGNHVQITMDVRFSTHGATWILRRKYKDFDCFGKIVVGDNVYIGNCAIILPGITIGDNVIVGAGSVVTKSIPNNTIVAGNPAKIIGNSDEFESKMIPFNVNTKGVGYQAKKALLLSLSEDKFVKK